MNTKNFKNEVYDNSDAVWSLKIFLLINIIIWINVNKLKISSIFYLYNLAEKFQSQIKFKFESNLPPQNLK